MARPATSADRIRDLVTYFTGSTATGVGSLLNHPVGNDITALIRDAGKTYDLTGAIYASMCLTLKTVPGNQLQGQSNALTTPTVSVTIRNADGTTSTRSYDAGDYETMPEGELKAFTTMFFTALTSARQWLLDLTACYQVRALTATNIQGYFASMNGTAVRGADIIPLLEVSKNQMAKITASDDLRNLLTQNKFMRYHTSASSTAGLVKRAVADCREIITIETKTADLVDEAERYYWDLDKTDQIPTALVAFTHAYLSATGALPGNWYQGERAASSVGLVVYRRWINVIRKWIDLVKAAEGIDATTSIDELSRLTLRIGIHF